MVKNRKGFTLLELVICIALLSSLAVSFYHMVASSLEITKRTAVYEDATSAFGAYANGLRGSTLSSLQEDTEEIKIPIIGNHSVSVQQHRIMYTGRVLDTAQKSAGHLDYYTPLP